MKKSILAVLAAVMLTGSLSAATSFPVKDKTPKSLVAQIAGLIGNGLAQWAGEETVAQVRFTFNQQGEIVVLSVDTDNEFLESFLKGRLNYKKVDVAAFAEGEVYRVPVRVRR